MITFQLFIYTRVLLVGFRPVYYHSRPKDYRFTDEEFIRWANNIIDTEL